MDVVHARRSTTTVVGGARGGRVARGGDTGRLIPAPERADAVGARAGAAGDRSARRRENFVAAFLLAKDAKSVFPSDPVWKRDRRLVARTANITTIPGAMRRIAPSERRLTGSDWALRPIERRRGAERVSGVAVRKARLRDRTRARLGPASELLVKLHTPEQKRRRDGARHRGRSARVAILPGLDHLPPQRLRDFWIDRYEVTNRDFKRFVDAGGYRDREVLAPRHSWTAPVGSHSSRRWRASSTRPGARDRPRGNPATFLEGQDDLPVTGVSWHEASAFAAWSGKSLPTIFHWSRVANQSMSGVVAPRSNFQGRGLMKVRCERRHEPLRRVRHGGQRQGMVLEPRRRR